MSTQSYVTVAEFVEMFRAREVVELSDLYDTENCEIDVVKVTNELINASRFADSHIRVRYTTPVDPTPYEIKRAVACIARYNLATLASEESRICYDYKDAVKYLEKIGKGAVHLDLVAGDSPQAHTDEVQSVPGISVDLGVGLGGYFSGY